MNEEITIKFKIKHGSNYQEILTKKFLKYTLQAIKYSVELSHKKNKFEYSSDHGFLNDKRI